MAIICESMVLPRINERTVFRIQSGASLCQVLLRLSVVNGLVLRPLIDIRNVGNQLRRHPGESVNHFSQLSCDHRHSFRVLHASLIRAKGRISKHTAVSSLLSELLLGSVEGGLPSVSHSLTHLSIVGIDYL